MDPRLPGPNGQLNPGDAPPHPFTHLVIVDALVQGRWSTAWDGVNHIVLPMVALALAPLASLVRILRANLFEVSREPFIQLVRSKGVSRRNTAAKHALPNAVLPTLTATGIVLGHLIGSAILVESVFQWPGVGALTVTSALRKDFALPETFVLLSAIFYVVVNMAVDVLYGVIDPRVRVRAEAAAERGGRHGRPGSCCDAECRRAQRAGHRGRVPEPGTTVRGRARCQLRPAARA